MKHYTTIEQSKKLIELGLSAESADMEYIAQYGSDDEYFEPAVFKIETEIDSDYPEPVTLPCWSLGALLEVMPLYLYDEDDDFYMMALDHNSNGWNVSYGGEDEYDFIRFADEGGKTPIEAAYNMVVWLLENGYIEKRE